MITKANITEFFEKYTRNLEQEEALNGQLLKVEDEESLMENLREKSKSFRRLYIENEAMLNLYLRPFLEQQSRLTEELAEEFFENLIRMCDQGYCDRVVCIQLAQVLQNYFREQGDWEKWIMTTHALGGFYSRYSELEDAKQSLACYDIEREAFERYTEIENWDIRRRILFAYYNYCAVLVNARSDFGRKHEKESAEYQENVMQQVNRALQVYDDSKVRELDGDKYDLDGLKEELLYDTYGNWICGCDEKEEMCPQMLEIATGIMKKLFEEAKQENDNLFEMKDEIYCNYWKILYYHGEIAVEEYVAKILEFCDYVLEHDSLYDEENFIDTRYYQVNMYHIPNLAGVSEVKNNPELLQKVKDYVLPQFKKFIGELPRNDREDFANNSMKQTMVELAINLGPENIDVHYFLNNLIQRDESMMIHTSVVKRMALTILQKVLDTRPELLIGMLGAESVVDVLEKREDYIKFISQVAIVYDIGKCEYSKIVDMQSRRLESSERKQIHRHSAAGYNILKTLHIDDSICEVALGHHKSYDGKNGYPEDFDNTKSKVRFFIDLIRICDCMGAATDEIGRIYNQAKTLEVFTHELTLGRGYLYNPDLVELICGDKQLYTDLDYICRAVRIALYYEAYHDFIGNNRNTETTAGIALQKKTEQENPDQTNQQKDVEDKDRAQSSHLLEDIQEMTTEQKQVLASLARSSLFIARIHINENRIHIVHNAGSPLLDGVKGENFHEFVESFGKGNVHPEDYPRLKRLMDYGAFSDLLYASEGSFELELRLRDGHDWRWIRAQFVLAEEKSSVPQVLVLTVTDIDTSKRQQMQLQEALEMAHKKAEQASRAKSEFLFNMSHDIRTPMNAILGMTQIAKQHTNEPEKINDCMEKIEQASSHLLQLINEVLDMSKIESGKMELDEKPVSLRKLMENMLMMTQGTVDQKRITRTVHMEKLPDETVYGDAVRIQEIMLNLMSNAVKYTPEGKWISFTAEKLDETIGEYHSYHFVVQDGGIGMNQKFLDKVFEPFAREQTEAIGKLQGTGLGHSITKVFVEMMQGNIQVSSVQNEGSTFDVILRFRLAEENAKTPQKQETVTMEQCRGRFAGRRILLTEDNELNREILKELITDTGVLIDEAENGQAAVNLINAHSEGYYDMVFMDVQMPVMNGYEAARAIRKLERIQMRKTRLPIIALTANVFAEDSDKAFNAGMDAHLGKPVELSKILAAMIRWLEKNE